MHNVPLYAPASPEELAERAWEREKAHQEAAIWAPEVHDGLRTALRPELCADPELPGRVLEIEW